MANAKHTKRELFQTLLVFATAAEAEKWILDGLQNELNLLDKRKAGSKGDAKKKAEQRGVKNEILAVLAESGEPMKATPIAKALAGDKSVQKVSALLKQMVDDNEVVREEVKKDAFFSLPPSE